MNLSVKMVRILLIALLTTTWACPWDDFDNSAVDEFSESWHASAHRMQRELQMDTPIKQSMYLHTHNAYNAEAYQDWTIRYLFPNQIYSMYDQMRLGVRVLELDLHYYLGTKFKKDILLCHGGQGDNDDLGCVVWDRPLNEGLEEIRDFLNEDGNENEIIIVTLESYYDDTSGVNRTLEHIKNVLGEDLVLKDADLPSGKSPDDMTNQEVIDTGKRVIFTSGSNYYGVTEYRDWVHPQFIGGVPDVGTAQNDIREAFANGYNCDDHRSSFNNKFVRNNNDGTKYGPFYDGEEAVGLTAPEEMMSLIECGINGVEADLMEVAHAKESVWSWQNGLPDNSGGNQNCAAIESNNRWDDENCAQSYRFACRGGQGDWQVTSASGAWEDGIQTCYAEFGIDYTFGVPVTGYDNRKLYEARNEAGASAESVWLNYSDRDEEGTWRSLNIDPAAFANNAPVAALLAYSLSADSVNAILGDEVSTWTDSVEGLSLTGSNAPQFSPIAVNGRPGLDFESGDTLTSADNADGIASSTIFAVVQTGSSASVVEDPSFVTATNGAPLSIGGVDGYVAEILIYGADLSASDSNEVTEYLEDKYGINITAP